jgi:hypothetical protein
VPQGYLASKSRAFGNVLFWPGFLVGGDSKAAVENFKRNARIYPLAKAAIPPQQKLLKVSGKAFNTLHANDIHFKYYPRHSSFADADGLLWSRSARPDARGTVAGVIREIVTTFTSVSSR